MQKTSLVLLHGFCENNSLWDQIIPNLNFGGEIIAPDLPGFGSKKLYLKNFNLDDIALLIHDELIALGVDKCICIGHSLGGYITLALKKQFPNFVIDIGLLHSTAFADNLDKRNNRDKLIKFLDKNPPSQFLKTFAFTLFNEASKDRLAKEVKLVVDMSQGLSGKTIQAYAKAMKNRKDNSAILFEENQPLFIAGMTDSAISSEDSELQISKIKNQKNCYLLENVAHMGMYESPSIIIEAINRFTSNNQLTNY